MCDDRAHKNTFVLKFLCTEKKQLNNLFVYPLHFTPPIVLSQTVAINGKLGQSGFHARSQDNNLLRKWILDKVGYDMDKSKIFLTC